MNKICECTSKFMLMGPAQLIKFKETPMKVFP